MLPQKLLDKISPDYILEDMLGSGSYGTVFQARRKKSGKPVAIKIFTTGNALSANCLNEVKLLFRLTHPHIVRAMDFFFTGNFYAIVFEFMNEGDLRRLMHTGKLDEAHALLIGLQIASGLDYIHSKGIIHRDLKPENILIHREAQEITYKICDFNISRFAEKGYLTASNQGSPLYMAPEQFYDRYDQRADLYALGVILYELLSGRTPFEGVYMTLMRAHINETPEWEHLEGVSEPTQAFIASLLSKAPEDRPPNAKTVFETLNALLQKQPLRRSHKPSQTRASSQRQASGPVLTFDQSESTFYLKYLDSDLWKECYSLMALPDLSALVHKDYLNL